MDGKVMKREEERTRMNVGKADKNEKAWGQKGRDQRGSKKRQQRQRLTDHKETDETRA